MKNKSSSAFARELQAERADWAFVTRCDVAETLRIMRG